MAQKLIAIGASTGGVEALEQLFSEFPANFPPVLVVIHMPIGFTKMFAARMNATFPIMIKEAENGTPVTNNEILVAPAGKHMILANKNGKYITECFTGKKVNNVIPSVDVLFKSVAARPQLKSVGVILTGLGGDGAEGLLEMQKNGAQTIGQDRATCAIYGMPKVAYEMGAVQHQLPLEKIAKKIFSLI